MSLTDLTSLASLVSSLAVLRPPRFSLEYQDERTPRPPNSKIYGAYAWGKCIQEEIVEREAPSLGITTRIVRPGALVDWNDPELPGAMGRHLFGRWHICFGRPGLPIPVCGVERCAQAIAWCATHFDEAPPLLNLIDPTLATRGEFVARLRSHGWTGRIAWVPISAVAFGVVAARAVAALAHGRWPSRLSAWSILRPRRYDARLAATVLETASRVAGEHPSPQLIHV